MVLLCPALVAAAGAPHILVVHSYSQEYQWTKGQHEGFVEALEADSGLQVVVDSEYLDTKRRSYEPVYAEGFAEHLRFKYADYVPTAIYTTDDNALDFALQHLSAIFPGVPVFFSGVNDYGALERIAGRRVSGVFEKKEIAPNLRLLAEMGVSSREILVIGDGSPTYRAIEPEIRSELQAGPKITARFVADDRLDRIIDEIAGYPDVGLFLTTLGGVKNHSGQTLPLRETIEQIVGSHHRVIISMEDAYMFDGVLGGYVTSGKKQGATAAGLLQQYLATGDMPAPILDSPNLFLFDARELAHHHLKLPESRYPDAVILNRPLSFYQRYRSGVLAALGALTVLFTLSLIGFLLMLSRKNRQIQLRSAEFEEQAEIALRAKASLNEAEQLARQGSWDWHIEGDLLSWSEGLRHLCGEAMTGFRHTLGALLEQLPEDDRDDLTAIIEEVRDSGKEQALVHRLRTDGGLRTVRETIRPIRNAAGVTQRLIGTIQDVTEQYLAESQLRESEEKYRRLFELSEDPMWLLIDQDFVMANQAASRVLGYESTSELAGVHPSCLSPERQPDGLASREKANEMIRLAYSTGYHRFEWLHKKKDGSVFPVEVSLTKVPYRGGDALFCIWRDITGIKKAQTALEEKTAYLDGILASSERVAIIATDADGMIRYFNPSAEKLFDIAAEQLLGEELTRIHQVQPGGQDCIFAGLKQAREHGEYRFTMKLQRDDGIHSVDSRISPISKGSSDFAGYMLMCEDITEQRRASELIEYHATYDPLTNLPNRRLFMDQLHQALARAKRHGHQSALLFLDLDNFKTINDSLGHPVGDTLLREVAIRIKTTLREEDTVARLGGDEFVVLLSELSDSREEAVSDVQAIAEGMRQTLSTPYHINAHELHVTPSIGIAVFPSGKDNADDVLRQADTAMYQAKDSGRNAVRFFLPSMQLAAEKRLRMIGELRKALPRSELVAHFQPQFNAQRQLCGAETLLRWQHPQQGLVMPGEFIHLAEEAGLVVAIGDWTLREALYQFKSWHNDLPGTSIGRVAVNVSALQFRQDDFVNKVEQALGDTGADPTWLTLEMTESILLEDFEATVSKIQQLKRLGVRFSIDDFGTGYSSLAYLKRLPVDEIKIDRSFVRDVMVDPNDAALVDTIMTMARHIGLDIVAEGVETEPAFSFLRERGCPTFQGYFFGRPCAAEEFTTRFLHPDQPDGREVPPGNRPIRSDA
jgi:diguanylate cyclase (GGDEF)-like protein/PAS domain S-box-containing protein